MKYLLTFCCLLWASCSHGAVPTLESFEPTQFATNNNRVAYRDPWTNDVGIVYQAIPNSLTLITNLNSYGTFSLPAKVTLLTLGTNYLDLSTNSTWLLNSPTNDATQVIISLSAGQYQGQLLFLTSQNGSNSFTLPDLSEQWDVPGAYVDIQGDWVGTTNRGMILQYTSPDWIEMARFDPSPGGGGGTVLGGGSTPFLPYWTGPATLADSPVQRLNSEQVKIVSGGNSLTLGMGSGSGIIGANASLQISAGAGVLVMNGGQYLTPSVGGVGIVLGYDTNYYGGLFLGTNGLFGVYTDVGTQLLRNGIPVGGSGITINPTDGFIPYRLNSTTFSNSPIKRVDSVTLGINGIINLLTTSGNDLVFSNTTSSTAFLTAFAADTNSVGIGFSGLNAPRVKSTGAINTLVVDGVDGVGFARNGGSPTWYFNAGGANHLLAATDNANDIGGAANNRPRTIRAATSIVTPIVYYNQPTNTVFDTAGYGTPEGAITADIGSTYRRYDGGATTSFYVKTANNASNTGWTGK